MSYLTEGIPKRSCTEVQIKNLNTHLKHIPPLDHRVPLIEYELSLKLLNLDLALFL